MTKCDCGLCEYRNGMWWRGPEETDGLLSYDDARRWNFCPHCGTKLSPEVDQYPKRYKLTALNDELIPMEYIMISASTKLSRPDVLILRGDVPHYRQNLDSFFNAGFETVIELPAGCEVCEIEEIAPCTG